MLVTILQCISKQTTTTNPHFWFGLHPFFNAISQYFVEKNLKLPMTIVEDLEAGFKRHPPYFLPGIQYLLKHIHPPLPNRNIFLEFFQKLSSHLNGASLTTLIAEKNNSSLMFAEVFSLLWFKILLSFSIDENELCLNFLGTSFTDVCNLISKGGLGSEEKALCLMILKQFAVLRPPGDLLQLMDVPNGVFANVLEVLDSCVRQTSMTDQVRCIAIDAIVQWLSNATGKTLTTWSSLMSSRIDKILDQERGNSILVMSLIESLGNSAETGIIDLCISAAHVFNRLVSIVNGSNSKVVDRTLAIVTMKTLLVAAEKDSNWNTDALKDIIMESFLGEDPFLSTMETLFRLPEKYLPLYSFVLEKILSNFQDLLTEGDTMIFRAFFVCHCLFLQPHLKEMIAKLRQTYPDFSGKILNGIVDSLPVLKSHQEIKKQRITSITDSLDPLQQTMFANPELKVSYVQRALLAMLPPASSASFDYDQFKRILYFCHHPRLCSFNERSSFANWNAYKSMYAAKLSEDWIAIYKDKVDDLVDFLVSGNDSPDQRHACIYALASLVTMTIDVVLCERIVEKIVKILEVCYSELNELVEEDLKIYHNSSNTIVYHDLSTVDYNPLIFHNADSPSAKEKLKYELSLDEWDEIFKDEKKIFSSVSSKKKQQKSEQDPKEVRSRLIRQKFLKKEEVIRNHIDDVKGRATLMLEALQVISEIANRRSQSMKHFIGCYSLSVPAVVQLFKFELTSQAAFDAFKQICCLSRPFHRLTNSLALCTYRLISDHLSFGSEKVPSDFIVFFLLYYFIV